MSKNNFLKNLINKKVFIVAEISANHGQNIEKAFKLVEQASDSGADAVKFQTYTPDTMTINSKNKYFFINHPEWGGQSLYELYKKAQSCFFCNRF